MCTSPWFSFSSTRSTNQGASIPRICRYNSRSCILGLSHPEIVTHYKAGIPVFVNLDPKAESLTDFLGGLVKRVAPLGLNRLQYFDRHVYDIPCNWKVFIDNY